MLEVIFNTLKNINQNCKIKFSFFRILLYIFIISTTYYLPSLGYASYLSDDEETRVNLEDCYYKTVIIEQKLVHTVTVNPNKYKIINAIASITGKNADFVSNIASKYNALVGINGGFFRKVEPSFFVPAGPLKVVDLWHGIAYQPRAAIGWKANSNVVLIDRLKTKTSVQVGSLILPVYYFNPKVNANVNDRGLDNKHNLTTKATLYSNIYPDFMKLNKDYPNILIKHNGELGYIYQQNNHIDESELAKVSVEVLPQLEPEQYHLWQQVDFITSGAPLLIKNYDLLTNYSQEKISPYFINSQHARSAVCILGNGFWKFVVTSNMTIPELANAMQFLQCKDAINLDGGSSSSMYLSSIFGGFNLEVSSTSNPVTDVILVLP